jgi:hypothetical protein
MFPPTRERWTTGYTQAEIDIAQQRYGLRFPPDLVALFRERRPIDGYDWRIDDGTIRSRLAWPYEGLLFDVERNSLWRSEWGERPDAAAQRAAILRSVVDAAPRLIPLISHRYIPEMPHETGNPVLSVHQSDIIYYGSDLADYFEREFGDPARPLAGPIKRVPFWSDFIE